MSPNDDKKLFAIVSKRLSVLIAGLALFSSAHAQTAGRILNPLEGLKDQERHSRLVEGAKKEGRLVSTGL